MSPFFSQSTHRFYFEADTVWDHFRCWHPRTLILGHTSQFLQNARVRSEQWEQRCRLSLTESACIFVAGVCCLLLMQIQVSFSF